MNSRKKGNTTMEVGGDAVAVITIINAPVNLISFDELDNLKSNYERATDVEVCPKCDQVMMIPSCSRPSCNRGRRHERKCKGCWFCVPRCTECAVCLGSDTEIQEAACGGNSLCLDCWLVLPKCRFCNKPYCTSHSSLRHDIATNDPLAQPMFECQACQI